MTDDYNYNANETVEELTNPVAETTQEATTPEQPKLDVMYMPPTVDPIEGTTDDKSGSPIGLIIGGALIAGTTYGAVKGIKWLIGKYKAAKEEKQEFKKWKEERQQEVVESHEIPEETEKLDETDK